MKKFLAVLLTLCMLMSVITIPVSAAVEVDGKEIGADDTNYVGVSDGSSMDGWAGGSVTIDSSTVNNGKTATAVRFDFTANGKGGGQSFYVQYVAPSAKDISKMQYLAFDFWVDTAETAKILNQHQFMFELSSSGKADTSEINTGGATFLKVWGRELSVGWNHVRIPIGAYMTQQHSGVNGGKGDAFDATKWSFFRIYNNQNGNGFTDGYKYSYMIDNFRFEAGEAGAKYLPRLRVNGVTSGAVRYEALSAQSLDLMRMTHLSMDIYVPETVNLDTLNKAAYTIELTSSGKCDVQEAQLSLTFEQYCGKKLQHGLNSIEIPLAKFASYGHFNKSALKDVVLWNAINYTRIHSNGPNGLGFSNVRFTAKADGTTPAMALTKLGVPNPNTADPLMASTCAEGSGVWKNFDKNVTFNTSVTDKSSDGVAVVNTTAAKTAVGFLKLTYERGNAGGLDIRGYRYMEFDLYVKSATDGVTDDAVAEAFSKIALEFEMRSYNSDNLEILHRGTLEALTGETLHGGWNHVVVDLSKFGTSGSVGPMFRSNFGAIRIFNHAISGDAYATTLYFDNLQFTKDAGDETVTRAATSKPTAGANKQYVMSLNLNGKYDLTNRDTVEFDLTINNEADVEKFNSYNGFNFELTSSGNCDHLEICYVGALKQYAEGGAFKAGVNHVAVPLSVFTNATPCSNDANSGNKCTNDGHRMESANFFSSNNWEFDPTRCNYMRIYTGKDFASDAANTVELSNVKFTGTSGYPFKAAPNVPAQSESDKVTINTDGLSVNHGTECSLDGTPAEVVGTVTNAENIADLTYEYIWMTEANVKLDAAPTKGGRYKVGIKVADNAKGYYGYAELPVFEIAHKYTDDCDDTCDICGEKAREASHDWKFLGREAVTPTKENGWASATLHRYCDRCKTDDPDFVISREPNVILQPECWKNSVGTIGTAELGNRIGGKGMITYTANVSAAASFRPLAKLAESVDISDMEYLVFDLYVPAAAVKMFNEKLFELELTSSGGPDKQEDTFRGTIAGLAGKPIVEGWNHVVLPLSSFVGKGEGGLNKTSWNFIRLFNHEKWDAAATITVGIANFHFTTDLESDFSKTTTFKVLTDEEKNYLDSSAKGAENSGRDSRYADKADKFIYKYSLGTGVADLTGIYWSAPTYGQLKLEVGVAAAGSTPATYYPVYTYPVASAGNDEDKGLSAMLRAYDLLAVLKENSVTLADNNVIFVKISDADTATGNGGAVKNISNVALTLEYKMPTEHDGDMHIVTGAYGADQHWMWCVSCNAVVGEKADHTWDSPCDPDCNDDCGYVRDVAHVTDGDIYDYVGTEHWQLCLKCGERINRGDHTFDNECDATCNLCGFVRNVHHTTDGKWFFDASGHWMICRDCGARVDFAAHKYENLCGGTCEICGFVHAIEHTWADEMGMDEHNHWYVCTVCGETDEVTAHVFDNSCDKDCNVCGYVRDVEHKFDTKWSSNGAGHYHACVNCGEPDKVIAHTFSNECDEDCDVCGYVRTATHVTSGAWEHDGENHWKVCTKCGKKVNLAVHVFDNACDADCNICGMTREVAHAFGEKHAFDEDGHWRVCEKCGTKEAAQAHVFGDGCGTTCDVCGYVRGKVDHVFNGEWTFDGNNHWHACSVCGGAIQDSAAHTWNAGKATVGGVTVHTCTVCGAIKTVKADSERPAPEVKPADDTVQLPADIAVVIEDVTSSIGDKVMENIKNGLKNNKTVIEVLGKNAEVISHFDISLFSDGAKVQPGGKVKVTIPASAYEHKNGVDYLVVYVDEDGNITPCETTQHEDGTLEFTTDHFSHYAIVGNTTSGGAPVWVFILIGVVAIAAVAAIVVVTMKKKKAKA